jgi:hypothetical protein
LATAADVARLRLPSAPLPSPRSPPPPYALFFLRCRRRDKMPQYSTHPIKPTTATTASGYTKVFAEEPEVEGDSSSPDGLGVGSAGSERSVDVGTIVGSAEGADVGADVGVIVGDTVGADIGADVGVIVGSAVGADVGAVVGVTVGAAVGGGIEQPFSL